MKIQYVIGKRPDRNMVGFFITLPDVKDDEIHFGTLEECQSLLTTLSEDKRYENYELSIEEIQVN